MEGLVFVELLLHILVQNFGAEIEKVELLSDFEPELGSFGIEEGDFIAHKDDTMMKVDGNPFGSYHRKVKARLGAQKPLHSESETWIPFKIRRSPCL